VQTVRVKSVEKKTETPEGAAETTEGASATPVDPATAAATGVQPLPLQQQQDVHR
jgi:hypothetical protein